MRQAGARPEAERPPAPGVSTPIPEENGPFVAEQGELPLSGAALTALMREVLARPAPFRFRAGGSSMAPFVLDGDVIRVSPLARAPGLGAIVAFVNPATGRLVVHRVIARRGEAYLLRGDNSREGPEGPVTRAGLLGEVTAIQRNGRNIQLGLGPERWAIALLSRLGWLAPLSASLGHVKRSVMRRLSGR